MHTTNYYNTFITVAPDSTADCGTTPPTKTNKSVALLQWELIINNPYKFTSDELLFDVFAVRNDIIASEYESAKSVFFSKGQPCLRASPLTKTYGLGVHYDQHGRIAIYGRESIQYEQWCNDPSVKVLAAMRSSKK